MLLVRPQHAELALSLIPFACSYVDLLCRNLSIRTKSISAFISSESPTDSGTIDIRFEQFYSLFDSKRIEALEGMALVLSTLVLSIAIVPIGISTYFPRQLWNCYLLTQWPSLLFIASGGGGILASGLGKRLEDSIFLIAAKSYELILDTPPSTKIYCVSCQCVLAKRDFL